MSEEERDYECMFDNIPDFGNLDDLIDGLKDEQKEHIIRVEANIKIMLDDIFRDINIRNWLKQKQIYFGWNHNYNIKPADRYIALEDLKKLIINEELSCGRGYEKVIYWEDIIRKPTPDWMITRPLGKLIDSDNEDDA